MLKVPADIYQHLNSGIRGNLESLAFYLSTRSNEFLIQTRSAGSLMWSGRIPPVVVDLLTWELPKITSIGNITCRPNIKKKGISYMLVLNDVL